MKFDQTPQPGLNGTYEGSCTICLHPTDTALAFVGEPEFIIAAGMRLGMTMNESAETLRQSTGCDNEMVPCGEITVVYRVCTGCAEGHGFTKPALVYDAVPCYTQGATA